MYSLVFIRVFVRLFPAS